MASVFAADLIFSSAYYGQRGQLEKSGCESRNKDHNGSGEDFFFMHRHTLVLQSVWSADLASSITGIVYPV